MPSRYINIPRYQTLRNVLIEKTGNSGIEFDLDQLLSLIGISDSIDGLLLTLENFREIISITENICQDNKWHRIKALITGSRFPCEAILRDRTIIKQKAIRLAERSGTRHNSSFRSRIKTSPLYATLSYLPENRLYLQEYRQLQTQVFVIKLLVEAHQAELGDELLDALTAIRSIAAHESVALLPEHPLTPEDYLEALNNIDNDSHLPRIINFLERGLVYAKTYSLKELEKLLTGDDKPTRDIDPDPSFIEPEIPKEEWPEIVEEEQTFDEDHPSVPSSAVYIVAKRNTPKLSQSKQRRVATQVANARAMDNQLFYFDWDRLNAHDLKALFDFFEGKTLDNHIELIEAKAYIALMFASGMPHEKLVKVLFGPTELPSDFTNPRLLDNMNLKLYSPGPKLKTTPTRKMQRQACPCVTYINLTLPPYISAVLQQFLELRPPTEGRLFNGAAHTLLRQATATINKLKSATGTRLTLTRIERFVERQLASSPFNDITTAALTLGKDIYLARTKIHYGAFDVEELDQRYSLCCSDVARLAGRQYKPTVDLLCAPPAHLGTPRRPLRNAVQGLIERLKETLHSQRNKIKTTKDLVRFHNAFTLYTAVVIAYSTGHRAVNTPYITEEMYDAPSGFAIIRDKDSQDFYHSHLVWLPRSCRRQLVHYRTHIKRIKSLSAPLPASQNKYSEFFFLTEKGQREAASKSTIERHLVAWDFYLPANVQRHFLKSELQENGCPADIIEAMLGHWHHGQEGWAVTSALHPQIFKKSLEEYLLPLTDRIGLRPIEGIQTPPRKISLDLIGLTQVEKEKKRSQGKKKSSPEDKNLLRNHPPGQAWLAVLTDYFRSQPVDKAFKFEQIKVLKLIFRAAPKLYVGEPKLVVPDTLINMLLTKIKPKPMVVKTYHLRANYLIDVLEWGKNNLEWSVNIPARPVYVPKPFNMVRPAIMRLMKTYRSSEKAFLADLENNPPVSVTPEWQIEQILLSAILYGGIIQRPWAEALLKGIRYKRFYQHQALMWVDLWKNPIKSTACRDLWQKQKNPSIYRRWIADQTTQFLLYRWLKNFSDGSGFERAKIPPLEVLYERMVLRLKETTGHQLPSLKILLEAAAAWATLNLPAFLVAYAKGRTLSASLPDPSWYRAISGEYLALSGYHQPEADTPAGEASKSSATDADQAKLLTRIRASLKGPVRAESLVAADIKRDLMENALYDSNRALSLLGRWSIQLLSKKQSELEHRHKQLAERPSTVDNYLGSIGHDFLAIAGNVDLQDLQEEENAYLALVKAVVKRINSRRKAKTDDSTAKHQQRTDYVIERLNQFLGYLCAFENYPYLQVSRDKGQIVISESGDVRSGLINYEEYRALLAELGWGKNRTSRYQKVALCIVILAFRTGMRFSEIWGLALDDVQGAETLMSHPEILVQRNSFRKLKTESSRRRIPLILLPANEREFVLSWHRFRMTELGSKKDMPLFTSNPMESEPIDKSQLAAILRSAIKQVTGDADLNIHSFRHSFLSLFLANQLSLFHDNTDLFPDFFCRKDDNQKSVATINKFLLENETCGRKTLYAGAILMGHSSTATGLETYFHLPEYLIAHYLNHPQSRPLFTGKAIQALTGTSQATAYRTAKDQDRKLRDHLLSVSAEYARTLKHPLSQVTTDHRPSNFIRLPEEDSAFDLVLHKIFNNPEKKARLRWPTSTIQFSVCKLIYERLNGFIVQNPTQAEAVYALLGNQYKRHDRAFLTHQTDQARLALSMLEDLHVATSLEHYPSRWIIKSKIIDQRHEWSLNIDTIDIYDGDHLSGKKVPHGALRIKMEEINVWGYRLEFSDKLAWLFLLSADLIKSHLNLHHEQHEFQRLDQRGY